MPSFGGGYGVNSVGSAASRGIEAGFNMGLQVDQAAEQKRARGVQEALQARTQDRADEAQARLEARDAATQESQQRLFALKAADDEIGTLRSQAADFHAASTDVPAGFIARYSQLTKQRSALVDSALQPWVNKASQLAVGQADLGSMPPADVYKTITAATRMTPQQIEQASQGIADVHAGMDTNNQSLVLQGANKVLARELNQGVGDLAPNGRPIVRKELIALDPAQDASGQAHPDKVIPRLRVYTDDGGYYDAPLTVNRTPDPNDKVQAVSIADLMNRLGNMGALTTALRHPEVKAKYDQGAAQSQDWTAQVLGVAGAAKQKASATQAKIDAIDAIDADTTLTPEQRAERKAAISGIRPTAREKNAGAVDTILANAPQAEKDALKKNILLNTKPETELQASQRKLNEARAGKLKGVGASSSGMSGAVVGSGSIGKGAGDQETVDFWAKAVIAGDRTWQIGLARSKGGSSLIEAVKRRVPAMAKELGLEPQDIGTTHATQVALTKTLADRQKYVTAVEQLNNTLDKQITLVESLLDKGVANGGGAFLNKPIQALRSALGDTDLAALDTALTGMAREHQRVLTSPMSNAQLHVAAQETADKLANRNMTGNQLRAVMRVMRTEAVNGKQTGLDAVANVQQQMRQLGRGTGPPAAGPVGAALAPGTPTAAPNASAADEALINKYLKR